MARKKKREFAFIENDWAKDENSVSVCLLSVERVWNSWARLPPIPCSPFSRTHPDTQAAHSHGRDSFQISKHSQLNKHLVNAVLRDNQGNWKSGGKDSVLILHGLEFQLPSWAWVHGQHHKSWVRTFHVFFEGNEDLYFLILFWKMFAWLGIVCALLGVLFFGVEQGWVWTSSVLQRVSKWGVEDASLEICLFKDEGKAQEVTF